MDAFGGGGVLTQSFFAPARALFSICVAVAALDTLVSDSRSSAPFRALCALAATACAVSALLPLLG